jgi:hypothetical protein
MQQLVKTCFYGNKYVHNSRGTSGGSVFCLMQSYTRTASTSESWQAPLKLWKEDQARPGSSQKLHNSKSHETEKCGHEPHETQNQEWLCWWNPAAIYLTWPNSTWPRAREICETETYGNGSSAAQNQEWLCWWRLAVIYLSWPDLAWLNLTQRQLWDRNIRSWATKGLEPRMPVLAKSGSNLPDRLEPELSSITHSATVLHFTEKLYSDLTGDRPQKSLMPYPKTTTWPLYQHILMDC